VSTSARVGDYGILLRCGPVVPVAELRRMLAPNGSSPSGLASLGRINVFYGSRT
jgi:hypothetical protein